jgi:hypothetical protein
MFFVFLRDCPTVPATFATEAQLALGLAEFRSLRSSLDDRDLLVPRSAGVVPARAFALARSVQPSQLSDQQNLEGAPDRPSDLLIFL